MTAQLWIRNPSGCIREVVAAGARRVVWDAGYIGKRKVEPTKLMDLFYGAQKYEYLLISPDIANHYKSDSPEAPVGNYPVWDASTGSVRLLNELVQNPIGKDRELCDNTKVDEHVRPIFGQDHRVIVHNIPALNTLVGKRCLYMLHELQLENPKVQFFIHGLYGYLSAIKLGFHSFDIEPRTSAMHGKVQLPTGKEVHVEREIHRHQKWVATVGFKTTQLREPAQRCIFNIKAAQWAVLHTIDAGEFKTKSKETEPVDTESPDSEYKLPTTKIPASRYTTGDDGDRIECDTCSLADTCKHFRVGSICTLPGSEMSELAQLFDTTDTATLLQGMAKLTAMNAKRAEMSMAFEADFGIDPETSKIIAATFDMAMKYAKLNDPRLRATVNLNKTIPGSPNDDPAAGFTLDRPDPKQIARQAIEYYAELGIEAKDVTQEMTRQYILKVMGVPAIEGKVEDKSDNQIHDAEEVI